MDRKGFKLPALALAAAISCVPAFKQAASDAPDENLPLPPLASTLKFSMDYVDPREQYAGYKVYCQTYGDCENFDKPRRESLIVLTPQNWAKIQKIHHDVYSRLTFKPDFEVYPAPGGSSEPPDVWTRGETGVADCEDFMLGLEHAMIKAKFPRSAVLKVVFEIPGGDIMIEDGKEVLVMQKHAGLMFRTTRGYFTTDNLTKDIIPVDKLPRNWRIHYIERPERSLRWSKAWVRDPDFDPLINAYNAVWPQHKTQLAHAGPR